MGSLDSREARERIIKMNFNVERKDLWSERWKRTEPAIAEDALPLSSSPVAPAATPSRTYAIAC